MALRSLGSSLVGRVSPSSPLRKTIEEAIQTPKLPLKGEPGSLERQFIEQPLEKTVPPGSQKVTSVSPTIDATSQPSVSPTRGGEALLAGAIGQSNAPLPNTAPGANNQPLFQGGITPNTPGVAAQAAPRGRTPVYNSVAGVPTSIPEISSPSSVLGGKSEVKAPTYAQGERQNPLTNFLGGRVIAAEPKQQLPVNWTSTIPQALAGVAGKALTTVGTKLKAPQLAPGGLGAQLQSWGGQPTRIATKTGPVSRPIQLLPAIGTALRSITQSFTRPFQNLRSFAFR